MEEQHKILRALNKKYPEYEFYLASGGLFDVKGKNTSDIDISLYHADYENLDHVFSGFTKKS